MIVTKSEFEMVKNGLNRGLSVLQCAKLAKRSYATVKRIAVSPDWNQYEEWKEGYKILQREKVSQQKEKNKPIQTEMLSTNKLYEKYGYYNGDKPLAVDMLLLIDNKLETLIKIWNK